MSYGAEHVGRVLSGRYRLLAPVGTGSSATVYVADDVQLRRRVAIKVLHDSLAEDPSFLRRFRAEARAAAALSHPNVLAVFDWGEEDGMPYLVTEYLAGGSLRSMLDVGRRLTQSQALLVGLDAARGLDYAHRRGFVHRDIKPANLLFDEDGRLRIADFGLARAIAEAAWTEPAGVVLGTARYASPEQAKGLSVDGKTDVYSLTLVLIEAVTGQVPFAADTTVATLMARLDKLMPVTADLGPLATVLERAGRPEPAERFDAEQLAKALVLTAERLPRPTPLPLVPTLLRPIGDPTQLPPARPPAAPAPPAPPAPDVPGWATSAPTLAPPSGAPIEQPLGGLPTGSVPTVSPLASGDPWSSSPASAGGPPPAPSLMGAGVPPPRDPTPVHLPRTETVGVTSTLDRVGAAGTAPTAGSPAGAGGPVGPGGGGPGGGPRPSLYDEGFEETEGRRPRRRWPKVLLVLVLVAALGVGAVAGYQALRGERVPTHLVQYYVGLQEGKAMNLVSDFGWDVATRPVKKDGTQVGEVVGQDPPEGTQLAEGGRLVLSVSTGPEESAVPDLTSKVLTDAEAMITASKFVVGKVDKRYDENVPADVVLEWTNQGLTVPHGTSIDLIVSAGPEPRTVPQLNGKPLDKAKAELGVWQLAPGTITEVFSDTVPAGSVVSTDPPGGTQGLARGSAVNIVVSKGPDLVTVPDVTGKTLQEAITALTSAGLKAGQVSGAATGKVVGTKPAASSQVKRGSSVDLALL